MTKAYQIAYESFGMFAMDQPPADRRTYRSTAMEAINGPDAGMVMDKLYQSLMSRSSINFGKIPESNGDLTRFVKYKTIAESLTLLDRQIGDCNIKELKLAHDLHDAIIKCREDFTYGFKTDSQFIKVTYNTMVYALCELINLCIAIYVDSLKAGAEGKPFMPEDYSNLLVVQNCRKFVEMVRSGEWAATMLTIKKDGRNFFGPQFSVTINNLSGAVGRGAGAAGAGIAAAAAAGTKAGADVSTPAKLGAYVIQGIKGMSVPKKIAAAIVAIIGLIIISRFILFGFYKGAYKLSEILDDQEKFLKAHMDAHADPSGTYKGLETQKKLYTMMEGLRSHIVEKTLRVDSDARKELKVSNATDLKKENFVAPSPADVVGDDNDDFSIT